MAHFLLLTVMALKLVSLRKRWLVQTNRGKKVIESGDRTWPFLLYPKTFCLIAAHWTNLFPHGPSQAWSANFSAPQNHLKGCKSQGSVWLYLETWSVWSRWRAPFERPQIIHCLRFSKCIFLFAYLSSCAYVCGHVWTTACVWRSEDCLQKAVSAFPHADPAARTQVVRLGNMCFYWLSRLIDLGSQLMKSLLTYGYTLIITDLKSIVYRVSMASSVRASSFLCVSAEKHLKMPTLCLPGSVKPNLC